MPWQDNKTAMDNVKEVPSQPTSEQAALPARNATPRGKFLAHLRRFWWIYVLLGIAGTLIIVLCLLYVAFPRTAQKDINKSTLTVNSLVLTNPTSGSFHLFQNSTVGNPTSYHPQLDAFNASVSLDGNPAYATIEIPQLHSTANAISIVNQDVQITDLQAFTDYTVAVLNQEDVKVHVKGRTGLHEMRFPTTHVDYDKTTTMKGLNKLAGFNVTSFTIKLEADPDGTNMVGEVYIPNPSDLTLTMGNVTFANTIPANGNQPATPVGNSTLNDLVLMPGNNTIPMRSVVNQTLVIEALETTYKDGILPIDIVGVSSVYNGQHLPYYESALQTVTQHISLNVGAALKEAGIDISALGGGGGGL